MLYTWVTNDSPAMRYAPDSRASAIYVADTDVRPRALTRYDSSIAKIAADGTLLWRRPIADGRVRALTAAGDAVVAAQWPELDSLEGSRGIVLAALSTSGEPLWEIATGRQSSFPQLAYLPPDRVALGTQSSEGRAEALTVHVRTGETQPITFPGGGLNPPWLRAANGDLLFFDQVLHRPYVSLLTLEGERRWWRGIQLDDGIRFATGSYTVVRDIQSLPDGRMALLAAWGRSSGGPRVHRTALLNVDGSLTELAASGRCLTADPVPIAALERRIHREFGIAVQLGDWDSATDPSTLAEACGLPTDDAYEAFLEAFYSELTSRGATAWQPFDEALHVRVTELGLPYRLEQFTFNALVFDAPRTTWLLRARTDSAASLVRYVIDETGPRMARMRSVVDEFRSITGYSLSARADSAEALDDLEAAAQSLIAEIERLSADERTWLQANRRRVFFDLQRGGFSAIGQSPQPIASARATLLDAVASAPEWR